MPQIIIPSTIDNEVVKIDTNHKSTTKNPDYQYSIWLRWCTRVMDSFVQYNLLIAAIFVYYYAMIAFDSYWILQVVNISFVSFFSIIILFYKPILVKFFRHTIGQKATGLQYNESESKKPSFIIITVREILTIIPFSEIISLFTILGSDQKKSLYDIICSTSVVKYKKVKLFTIKWIVAIFMLIITFVSMLVLFVGFVNTNPLTKTPTPFQSIEINEGIGYEILKLKPGNPFGKNWEKADHVFIIIKGELSQEKKDLISKKIPFYTNEALFNFYTTESNIRSILELDGDTEFATGYIESVLAIAE
jgi:uncharacterized RDD family membrane protein YckC